ncbi:MAG: hypothetical protein HOE48_09935 [Candidatus Latescibacteria bacterium]|jgi:hypothetical protein|nr:hypothetical protein [Candidatus Latescibacterota bacterium]MBT4138226.1 hypothetical protein [Candidatus Latescibacterota bacterium]
MYEWVRKIHLYMGIILLTFVVMYFVTGYVIIHPDIPLLKGEQTKNTTRMAFDLSDISDPYELSRQVQSKLELPGKRATPRILDDGRTKHQYTRPGEKFQVTVSALHDSVVIEHTQDDARRTLIGMHRLHKYGGGFVYNIWVLLLDLTSLSMIAFSLTGIYLWYKTSQKHRLGWLMLFVGYGYTIATVLYLAHAP